MLENWIQEHTKMILHRDHVGLTQEMQDRFYTSKSM